MNDTELVSLWSALEPSARRRARIETRVFDWLEASETSIAAEWLGLLKVEPLKALAYVSLGASARAPVAGRWIVSPCCRRLRCAVAALLGRLVPSLARNAPPSSAPKGGRSSRCSPHRRT